MIGVDRDNLYNEFMVKGFNYMIGVDPNDWVRTVKFRRELRKCNKSPVINSISESINTFLKERKKKKDIWYRVPEVLGWMALQRSINS